MVPESSRTSVGGGERVILKSHLNHMLLLVGPMRLHAL